MGVEGLVVKGEATPYRPRRSDWLKVKNRQTTEVIVGAVIGPISAREAVVAPPPLPAWRPMVRR